MKRLTLVTFLLFLAAPVARADDQAAFLDAQLRAWQEGPVPREARAPFNARRLVRYEAVSTVLARLNGADTMLVNALCVLEGPEEGKESSWRAVLRVSPDPKAPDGYRLTAAWRPTGARAPLPTPPPNPAPTAPLTDAQKTDATKLLAQLRNSKLDPGARNQKRDQILALGPAVVEIALRELRTNDMEHRRELVSIVTRLHPADEPRILRKELTDAVAACTRIVQRIQDDAMVAVKYREKAAAIKTSTGGNYGGLKFKPEPTDRESYLRLAAQSDAKVADSRIELDACVEVLEVACDAVACSATDDDLLLLLTLVSDKGVTLRAPAWSNGVLRDDEYTQVPPVGFSTRRRVAVAGQEQDWLPWGLLWGTLRTRVATCAKRETLVDLRDQMEKAFVPLEKKRVGPWQQTCLVTEFQRTEPLVIDRLADDDGPKPASTTPVECAGATRDRLLAALGGPTDKPGEDPLDKRRRVGRMNELRRSSEFTTYHVVMKYVPTAAADGKPTKLPGAPCFMTGAFDFFKEQVPVTAFLDARDGPGGAVTRVLLGSFDLPLRAPVAADVEKGKRQVRLELTGRLQITQAAPSTIGNVTDLVVPVEIDRLVLVDDATGETLSEKK